MGSNTAHAAYQHKKRHRTDDFKVSVAIADISLRWVLLGLWTRITSWKSVKIQKTCTLGLWILFHPDKSFLIFWLSDNCWIKNFGPENEVGKRYFVFHVQTTSCSDPYSFLMLVVRKSQARSRYFVKDRPESTS